MKQGILSDFSRQGLFQQVRYGDFQFIGVFDALAHSQIDLGVGIEQQDALAVFG